MKTDAGKQGYSEIGDASPVAPDPVSRCESASKCVRTFWRRRADLKRGWFCSVVMALSQILDISAGSRFLEQNGGFACLTRGFPAGEMSLTLAALFSKPRWEFRNEAEAKNHCPHRDKR
jgi:hypothetical protein